MFGGVLMFKKVTVILLVIFMTIIQIQPQLAEATGVTNDKSFISTTDSTTRATSTESNIPLLTQWVLDESTNTLYAISQGNKTLYFINATTLVVEKSLTFTGGPTDIIKDNGKLYITLDDKNQIAIVDMTSRTITQTLNTSSDPYRIVKDGNKLYYIQFDQWCDVYSYDLVTNAETKLQIGFANNYEPDIAINTDKHILYIGESGSSGSSMIYYSTSENKNIGSTSYNNGYGFPSPSRNTLFDGVNVYYASRDFISDNPQRCIGDFNSSVIFAKNGFAFTNASIYDATTHVKLGDYGSNMDLIEASSTTMYLYSSATGTINRFNNSNSLINSSNIISLISGTAAAPIQSNTKSVQQSNPKVFILGMNSELTQWVLDDTTNTIYGISNKDKTLFFINATTLNLEKSLTFTSGPTDIIMDQGKLYISLDDVNQIVMVDMVSRKTTGTLYTSSDPYRLVKDGNKLYYAERDQLCDIYAYDLITSTDQKLSIGITCCPDLAINTDKHILYIGESGSTGCNMTYYSTTDNKIIGKTNYNNGYGFSNPSRNTLFDGRIVYYAGRDFDPEDPTQILGSYGENIVFAKYGCAYSNTALYDSGSNTLLGDLGSQIDLYEISNRADFYYYSIQAKRIMKIEPDIPIPVITEVSPNNGSVKGGTVVNITGTGFTGATAVYFSDSLGTNLIVNSDSSITVTSPSASATGTVDIFILGPAGTNVISNNDKFVYTGLKVNVAATNGSITGLLQSYNYGDTVALTAVAAEGYTFLNWTDKSGNILSTSQVYSFKINDNVELHANFVDMCDIDKSGKVDILDLALVAKNYNMKSNNISWVSSLDFNKDGIIDIFDLVLCSKRMTM
jgi:hypothetical protein